MGVRVMRKDLESLVSLLMWFSSIAPFHRPFLFEFYKLLRKPRCVNKKVPHAVFGELLLERTHGAGVDGQQSWIDISFIDVKTSRPRAERCPVLHSS